MHLSLAADFDELARAVATSDVTENADNALDVLVGLLGSEERDRMLDRWRPRPAPISTHRRKPGPSSELRERLEWRNRTLWRLRQECWPSMSDSNAAALLMPKLDKYRKDRFAHDEAEGRRPAAEPFASLYDLLVDGVKLPADAKALRNLWSKRKTCA